MVAPEPLAISIALATLLGSFTFPETVTVLPLAETWMSSSGMSCFRKRWSPGASAVTSTELTRTWPELSQIRSVVVPNPFPLISTSVGDSTMASAMAGSPTENREIASGFTSSTEDPLDTEITRSTWLTIFWAAAPAGARTRRARPNPRILGSNPPDRRARAARTG